MSVTHAAPNGSLLWRIDEVENDVPVSAALDHYGVSGNREWTQYFAPEDSKPLEGRCPFRAPAKDSE